MIIVQRTDDNRISIYTKGFEVTFTKEETRKLIDSLEAILDLSSACGAQSEADAFGHYVFSDAVMNILNNKPVAIASDKEEVKHAAFVLFDELKHQHDILWGVQPC